jgi:hypothetical protein
MYTVSSLSVYVAVAIRYALFVSQISVISIRVACFFFLFHRKTTLFNRAFALIFPHLRSTAFSVTLTSSALGDLFRYMELVHCPPKYRVIKFVHVQYRYLLFFSSPGREVRCIRRS